MAQNTELIPLTAKLFSQFVRSIQHLKPEQIDLHRRGALEQDVFAYFHIVNEKWFQDQMATAKDDENVTSGFITIYHAICDILVIIDRSIFPSTPVEQLRHRFGSTGMAIYYYVSLTSQPMEEPLHEAFIPYIQSTRSEHVQVTGLSIDIVTLRNQTKCAHPSCGETSESTKTNLKFCAGCQAVRYCTKTCQAADWKEHKLVCKPLKAMLPVAYSFQVVEATENRQEFVHRFADRVVEGGLNADDLSNVRDYVLSHTKPWG
jgi:hypothetical protein